MGYIRKIINIVRNDGVGGVFRRLQLRLSGARPSEIQKPASAIEDKTASAIEKEKTIYQQQVNDFNKYISGVTFPGLENFYWYHSVDLGNGIVTPGDYDFRNSLAGFHFPEDMSGMRVLDVGSATGFFAFEFERRGAEVVSVELPSLYEWDMIHDEKEKIVNAMMYSHHAATAEEAFYRHLDGPFQFCQANKKTSIKRIYSSIYDLTSHLEKSDTFDMVFLGDILLHLFSPFEALNVIAPYCKSKLIVATDIFGTQSDLPVMRFMGTMSKGRDSRTWWMFNRQCVEEMLLRVGFREATPVGEYSGIMRRTWSPYRRFVFHATK